MEVAGKISAVFWGSSGDDIQAPTIEPANSGMALLYTVPSPVDFIFANIPLSRLVIVCNLPSSFSDIFKNNCAYAIELVLPNLESMAPCWMFESEII